MTTQEQGSQPTPGVPETDIHAMLRDLRDAPQAFAALFAQVSEDALHHRAADGWSAVEVIGHLADHDAFERTRRFAAILKQATPTLPDDETRFHVAKANYHALAAAEALAWFTRERKAVVALLEKLGPREWMRTGIHPRDGERSLLQLADLRGHDREHFEQARAAIASA
jgi:hypothetical protein